MPDEPSVTDPAPSVPPEAGPGPTDPSGPGPADPSGPGPADQDGPGPDVPAGRATTPRWIKWTLGVTAVVVAIVLAGFAIRLPYYVFSPGGTLPLAQQVKVSDAKTYPDRGDLRLLYVREQGRVSVWRWIQASLDPDLDLVKQGRVTQGASQEVLSAEAAADMASAKTFATKTALQAAGFVVPPPGPGLDVLAVVSNQPAAKSLQAGDQILAVDGHPLTGNNDLTARIKAHKPGDTLAVKIERAGKPLDTTVAVGKNAQGEPAIGVIVGPHYVFPVDVRIDTTGIGGPSAGLAMTLAIYDDLTPGNLTGGKRVAVTGTIDSQGHVGEIGGIAQKAVTARTAGAKLFIVPACAEPAGSQGRAACEHDLARAKDRAGKNVKVVAVATFDQALQALRNAGGAATTPVTTPAAR